MRRLRASLGVLLTVLGALIVVLGTAAVAQAAKRATPKATLSSSLASGIRRSGGASGGYVVDLDDRHDPVLIGRQHPAAARVGREALHDVHRAAALRPEREPDHLGARHRHARCRRPLERHAVPARAAATPRSARRRSTSFAYNGGATSSTWSTNLLRTTGITSIKGRVVGDESYFDSLRGTPATGYRPSTDVEGALSALVYNRGLTNPGTAPRTAPGRCRRPAVRGRAAGRAREDRSAHADRAAVHARRRQDAGLGPLAEDGDADRADQHAVGQLLRRDAAQGPRRPLRRRRHDRGRASRRRGQSSPASSASTPASTTARGCRAATSPRPRGRGHAAAARWPTTRAFVDSLAVAGRDRHAVRPRCAARPPQGRCQGKTGTLHDVSNLAGYCQAADGHTLAFAFMMNGVWTPTPRTTSRPTMAVALAKYNG